MTLFRLFVSLLILTGSIWLFFKRFVTSAVTHGTKHWGLQRRHVAWRPPPIFCELDWEPGVSRKTKQGSVIKRSLLYLAWQTFTWIVMQRSSCGQNRTGLRDCPDNAVYKKFDISFKETGLKETRKEFTLPKSRLAPGDHFKLINAADYFRDHLN